jgi:hypothetical protein
MLWASIPWLLVTAGLVWALLATDTPGGDVTVYGVYFALAVVLPGTLVHRLLRGSRGNLPEDLGYGAATGLLLQLLAWLLAAATGNQPLLRWWPVPIILVFAAVPPLWRHWRVANLKPLPVRWSWLAAAAVGLAILRYLPSWATTPLPPTDATYYQDLMYHLALVHEMMRSLPFQVPQLAGDTLRYHYLSNADMASASMITGISPATVLMRLWMMPIAATAIVVVAGLTREVTGKWWAGPLAGAVGIAGVPLELGAPTTAFGTNVLIFASPSQTYALPLLALFLAIAVDALRGRPLRWTWLIVFPLALACAGAKSSSLPPVVVGLVFAAVVVAFRNWRKLWPVLALLELTVVAMLLGLRLFAGGGAGTLAFQALSTLRWMEPYVLTLGVSDGVSVGDAVPFGVEYATTAGAWFIVWVLAWWILMETPRLLGLFTLVTRPTRTDPAAWLFGGMFAAGIGAFWLFWHPSGSQLYFFLGAAPFGAVLTVWLLAESRRRWQVTFLGLLAGGLWAYFASAVDRPAFPLLTSWAWALAFPVLRTVGLAAGVAIIALFVWKISSRRHRVAVGAVPVALVAAVVGASIVTGANHNIRFSNYILTTPPFPLDQEKMITQDEMAAAMWLDKNAGKNDVIATNVHCVPIGLPVPSCDSRAFWVAALAGRRTLIESWGYSDATVAANGVSDIKYPLQPPPYYGLYAMNENVFKTGDPVDLKQLRDHYGVRWLFADTRAADVTPRLAKEAHLRYISAWVTIYSLD